MLYVYDLHPRADTYRCVPTYYVLTVAIQSTDAYNTQQYYDYDGLADTVVSDRVSDGANV